jgi:hypothetical protein
LVLTESFIMKKLISVIIFIVFNLLISNRLYALSDDEDKLLTAIVDENITAVNTLLKAGTDPRMLVNESSYHLSSLHSFDIAVLLLNNGEKSLDPEKAIKLLLNNNTLSDKENEDLIDLIFSKLESPTRGLQKIFEARFKHTKIKLKNKLLELALAKGANPSELNLGTISSFIPFPTLAIGEKMLEKGFNPNAFLKILMNSCAFYDSLGLTEIKNNLAQAAIQKGANFADLNSFFGIPPYTIANVLLKNGYDPTKFLKQILEQPCAEYLGKGYLVKVSSAILAQKDSLMKLAFEYSADLKKVDMQKIDFLDFLPSKEVGELLLQKGLDPTIILNLSLQAYCDNDLLNRRNDLIDLTLQKGANLDNILYPEAVTAIKKKETYVGQNQYTIQNNLVAILEKVLSSSHDTVISKLTDKYTNNGYLCTYLSGLWLSSMWTQFVGQPSSQCEAVDITSDANFEFLTDSIENIPYNYDRFKNNLKFISLWTDQTELPIKNIQEIKIFALLLNAKKEESNAKDIVINENKLKLKYTSPHYDKENESTSPITSAFEKLTNEIKENVQDHDVVFISYQGHARGLFKHEGVYYYYDPANNAGPYANRLPEKIAETILSQDYRNPNAEVGLKIYSAETN